MSLNQQQKNLIITIDKKVNTILANGGDEVTLLTEMFDLMPRVKDIIDTVPTKEMEMYFYAHDGFYRYMKVLENLAQGIADGLITVPKE